MTDSIRSTRKRKGLKMATLANALGISESAVSQMEKSERDGTIRIETLQRALGAMGEELMLTSSERSSMSKYAPARVAHELASTLSAGNKSTAMRLLTFATNALADRKSELTESELATPPMPLPDPAWDSFARALYRRAYGQGAPGWTKPYKLAQPQYLLDEPVFRRRADRSPALELRKLNILIDERSYSRA
jgi:transcriptional regulator with XRE-family HTH domain